MSPTLVAFLVPAMPAVAAVLLAAVGKRLGERSSLVAIGALALSLTGSVWLLLAAWGSGEEALVHATVPWMTIGGMSVDFGLYVDGLSASVLAMIAAVALMVFIYATGYMKGDVRYPWFFTVFSLFTACMFGVVTASSLLQLMLFWEVMGLCSFLLIGYWYERPEARKAAFKAFITTRIGDMGFLLAVAAILGRAGTLDIPTLMHRVETMPHAFLWLMAALLFFGAVAKSAQFPLYIWLPEAMAGPTPVSGLLHSATMVVAGIFLVTRTYPLFEASGFLPFVAGAGMFTAVFGAALALTETDIKRMLAYSTMSQLGYMMAALGAGGYVAAVFHLITHGFFKSLLFLCAGSVIHATHTQDIRQMKGAGRTMPVTAAGFLIGALALSGIPPLAGFFSKDAILASFWGAASESPALGGPLLFAGLATAVLSAFYMFRVYFGVFTGAGRTLHESPRRMLVPIIGLASATVIAGAANLPGATVSLAGLLEPGMLEHAVPWLMVLSAAAAGSGVYMAWESNRLRAALHGLRPLPRTFQPLYGAVFLRPVFKVSRFLRILQIDAYVTNLVVVPTVFLCNVASRLDPDVLYMAVFRDGTRRISEALALFDVRVVDGAVQGIARVGMTFSHAFRLVDSYGIDGVVDGAASGTLALGRVLKRLQTGVTANYALFSITFATVVFYAAWWLTR